MGVEERKERDSLRMRNRILRAAMELFSKGGYKNVSMRRIAIARESGPAPRDPVALTELIVSVEAKPFRWSGRPEGPNCAFFTTVPR